MFSKLEKLIPSWVLVDRTVPLESEDETEQSQAAKQLAKTLGVRTKRIQPTMPLSQWMLAFEAYSLGAAATEQWPLDPLPDLGSGTRWFASSLVCATSVVESCAVH